MALEDTYDSLEELLDAYTVDQLYENTPEMTLEKVNGEQVSGHTLVYGDSYIIIQDRTSMRGGDYNVSFVPSENVIEERHRSIRRHDTVVESIEKMRGADLPT